MTYDPRLADHGEAAGAYISPRDMGCPASCRWGRGGPGASASRVPGFNSFDLFLAAALLVAVTPEAGIFYVAARTLAGGRHEGWASSFGAGLGGLVHVIAGAVGISALVMASAEAFAALKIVGRAISSGWV
jgi:hypothetical protein